MPDGVPDVSLQPAAWQRDLPRAGVRNARSCLAPSGDAGVKNHSAAAFTGALCTCCCASRSAPTRLRAPVLFGPKLALYEQTHTFPAKQFKCDCPGCGTSYFYSYRIEKGGVYYAGPHSLSQRYLVHDFIVWSFKTPSTRCWGGKS